MVFIGTVQAFYTYKETIKDSEQRRQEAMGGSRWRVSSRSALVFVRGNKCQRTADAAGTAEIYHRSLKQCAPSRVVEARPFLSASSKAVLHNATTPNHLVPQVTHMSSHKQSVRRQCNTKYWVSKLLHLYLFNQQCGKEHKICGN